MLSEGEILRTTAIHFSHAVILSEDETKRVLFSQRLPESQSKDLAEMGERWEKREKALLRLERLQPTALPETPVRPRKK